MVFALVLALAVGSVQGMATSDGGPLPGCTVSLASPAGTKHAVTNHEGKYQFYSVEPGVHDLLIELPGMEPVSRTIVVAEGVNELPAEELAVLKDVQTITISCTLGMRCQESAPDSVWELPSCTDYELNAMLIAGAEDGDRSAIELLRTRYTQAATYSEKHTIAGALLNRVPDDTEYWNELFEHAHNHVRLREGGGEYTEEFLRWCQERRYEPSEYDAMSYGALTYVERDPRARTLLEALRVDNGSR
jgi:Carboxypeptidase regulatory-like domain